MIIILTAMPEELQGLLALLQQTHKSPLFRQSLWLPGPMKTQEVFYGTLFGRRVAMTIAGVGKVQTAMTTAVLLERHRNEVDVCLFFGVAGGLLRAIKIGDLVVADRTMQHDVDATALNVVPGYNLVRGQVPFTESPYVACDPELVRIASCYVPPAPQSVHVGTIVTGDQFLNGPLRRRLGYFEDSDGAPIGAAIEMEGAAFNAAVRAFPEVRPLVVRTVSDNADNESPADFAEFVQSVAVNNTVGMARHVLSAL